MKYISNENIKIFSMLLVFAFVLGATIGYLYPKNDNFIVLDAKENNYDEDFKVPFDTNRIK